MPARKMIVYTVNSEIENLNDLLTDGDELLKVRIMVWVEKEHAVHQRHTDKKEKKIFFKYKEIQMGSVAMSYMRKSFIIYEEMHIYLTICEETVSYILLCNWSLLNFLICEEKIIFFLISTGTNWSRWGKVINQRYRKWMIMLLDIIWPQ